MISTVLVAVAYIGFMLLLLSGTNLGIYSAPIAMLTAFTIPMVVMFTRSQVGSRPLEFPYVAMSLATLVAAALAVGFHFLHPAGEWQKLPVIAALMLVWFASLFLLRIIPRYHWDPILHITKSALRRKSALHFDTKAGLSSLKAPERRALRTAVVDRLPPASLTHTDGDGRPASADGDGDGRPAAADGDGGALRQPTAMEPADPTVRTRRSAGWATPRVPASCACFAGPAGRAASRSTNAASSTPTSPCICSPTSPSRSACGRCDSS